MEIRYKVKTPDEVLATMTITAPVGDFRALKKRLDEAPSAYAWPLSGLVTAVRGVIEQAEKNFTETPEEPK
jgi:hypothetical protein